MKRTAYLALGAVLVGGGFVAAHRFAKQGEVGAQPANTAHAPVVPVAAAASTPEVFDTLVRDLPALMETADAVALEKRLAQLAEIDPERALKLAESVNLGQMRPRSIALAAWMLREPAAAAAWAKANHRDFFLSPEYVAACLRLRDVAWVEQGLLTLRSDSSSLVLQQLVLQWAVIDPDLMGRWISSLGAYSATTQSRARAGLIEALAREAPEEAGRWIDESIADDSTLRRYYEALARGLMSVGNVEGAERYFRAKAFRLSLDAYSVITRELAVQAPEKMEGWISAIDNPSLRPHLISVATQTWMSTRPDLAARLIADHDPEPNAPLGLGALKAATSLWSTRDSAAALDFIAKASRLTPESRSALQAVAAGGGG